jgi:hypothetical protein
MKIRTTSDLTPLPLLEIPMNKLSNLTWKVVTAPDLSSVCLESQRVIALFEGNEEDHPEPDEIVSAAARTAVCVNACVGIENPAHRLRVAQRDAEHLARYRDAYCSALVRLGDTRQLVRVLREEVRAVRAVRAERNSNADVHAAVLAATRATDAANALRVLGDEVEPVDITRYKGLDLNAVERLVEAAERVSYSAGSAQAGEAGAAIEELRAALTLMREAKETSQV